MRLVTLATCVDNAEDLYQKSAVLGPNGCEVERHVPLRTAPGKQAGL
jgi:hypothetical protein